MKTTISSVIKTTITIIRETCQLQKVVRSHPSLHPDMDEVAYQEIVVCASNNIGEREKEEVIFAHQFPSQQQDRHLWEGVFIPQISAHGGIFWQLINGREVFGNKWMCGQWQNTQQWKKGK